MRILVYKRTHVGDPGKDGCFGHRDCMRSVRDFEYDAVIGVGGMGAEPRSYGIDGRVNWIGVGPRKVWPRGGNALPSGAPLVRFDKFALWDEAGPPLHVIAPMLARRFYERKARYLLGGRSEQEQQEALELLKLLEDNVPIRKIQKKLSESRCYPTIKDYCRPSKRCE
jgi:hypothetical protein